MGVDITFCEVSFIHEWKVSNCLILFSDRFNKLHAADMNITIQASKQKEYESLICKRITCVNSFNMAVTESVDIGSSISNQSTVYTECIAAPILQPPYRYQQILIDLQFASF